MCNGEPRLRTGGLHYLGCFCSQPVLFRCSPLIWRIFIYIYIYGHYGRLCIKEVRADSRARWFANDPAFTALLHLLLMTLMSSTHVFFKCLPDPQLARSFHMCISLHESCRIHHSNLLMERGHGPCHPYYFSYYLVGKGRYWESERQKYKNHTNAIHLETYASYGKIVKST